MIALLAEDAWDYGRSPTAQAALTRAVYDYLQIAEGGAAQHAHPDGHADCDRRAADPTARRWGARP